MTFLECLWADHEAFGLLILGALVAGLAVDLALGRYLEAEARRREREETRP